MIIFHRFATECYLERTPSGRSDISALVCRNCRAGYEGRRCERCAAGYRGNPEVLGDSCRPIEQKCDLRGSRSNVPGANDQCPCKVRTVDLFLKDDLGVFLCNEHTKNLLIQSYVQQTYISLVESKKPNVRQTKERKN